MPFASSQGHAMVKAEKLIDGNGMVQRGPALGQVGGAAGYQERPWRHESMEFDQIVSGFDKRSVGPGSSLTFGRKLAKRTCILRISDHAQVKTQVPDVPVIDAATGVLFATVALVENDAGI